MLPLLLEKINEINKMEEGRKELLISQKAKLLKAAPEKRQSTGVLCVGTAISK